MLKDLQDFEKKFSLEFQKTKDLRKLDDLKLKYLGRKGYINKLLQDIKQLSPRERRKIGNQINKFKIKLATKIDIKKKSLLKRSSEEEWVDVTRPGKARKTGSLHIVTYAIEEISSIFEKLGFIRMSYPEVEWEYFAFEALNMPENHPARDDFETFFIQAKQHPKYGKMVLSPHTSSGQIREMLRVKKTLPAGRQVPIKMINMAKCYRPNWDVTHTPMFHQFEGLCIDRAINITHLKGTIEHFAQQYFGRKRQIRWRPFHFQFTEPSFEIDITCDVCQARGEIKGEKCRICKSGWLELAGAGMVHPFVLKEGGINPEKYSGWAFGFGVERVIMMREGLNIDDLRILYSGDFDFLSQF